MHRAPVRPCTDLDRAFALAAAEPFAGPTLHGLMEHVSPPKRGHAVVLRSRLGGLARAFAHAHPSWRVTALDSSVALLSASLDRIRPEGLGSQLTVMQSHGTPLPLPTADAQLVLADLPLDCLADTPQLVDWATDVARLLAPGGTLTCRFAVPVPPQEEAGPAPTGMSAEYADFLKPSWAAAFPTQTIQDALHQAGLIELHSRRSEASLWLVAGR